MDPAFTRLLHQLAPPSALLSFLPKESFPSADFQSSIHTVISTALSRPHPPPRSHIKRVLKALIENLESLRTQYGTEDDEIDEGLMSLYTELLVEPPEAIRGLNSATQKVPVGYTIPGPALRQKDSEIMTIYESPNVISGAGTTGFRTWEAALALCELLILSDRPRRSSTPMAFPPVHVGGQSVLELGAGTGAVSILAAKLGARKVLCTDGDSGMVNLAAGNVRVNKVGGVVECVQLLWGEEVGDGDGTDIRARLGLVLAADVTYDPEVIPSLVKEISSVLSKNPNAKAIVAATLRNFSTFGVFNDCLAKEGFKTRTIDWETDGGIFYYPVKTPVKIVFVER